MGEIRQKERNAMRKFKFGSVVLGTALIMSVEAHAYNVDLSMDKTKISAGDNVTVSVKLKNLEQEIDTYQAKFVYDKACFETVSGKDFLTQNGWDGLVYNTSNGIFVVERDSKTKSDQEVFSVTLKTKTDIDNNKLNIS